MESRAGSWPHTPTDYLIVSPQMQSCFAQQFHCRRALLSAMVGHCVGKVVPFCALISDCVNTRTIRVWLYIRIAYLQIECRTGLAMRGHQSNAFNAHNTRAINLMSELLEGNNFQSKLYIKN